MHEYATLLELKEALSIENGATFADGDASRALTAASRALDKMCGRRFYADDDALQVRYYTPFVGDLLPIDDLLVVTAVDIDSGDGTFSTSWSASADFILEPLNAAADGEPWTLVIPRARLPRPLVPCALPASSGGRRYPLRLCRPLSCSRPS